MTSKKPTKILSPVDERETFVSIASNFSESESVKEKLKVLYELQQADSKIDAIHQLRGELPVEVEDLEAEIETVENKIAAVQARLDASNLCITESAQQIVEYDAMIARYNEQLDTIANNREYDSLRKEIENLDLLRRIAEKHSFEAKDDVAKDSEILARHQEKLAVKQEDLEIKKQELAGIVEATAKEEQACQAERDALAAQIDERTLSAYEHVRSSYKNNLAVVSLIKGIDEKKSEIASCGGCFNQIPPQRQLEVESNKKLIICEFCGRILINPENFE